MSVSNISSVNLLPVTNPNVIGKRQQIQQEFQQLGQDLQSGDISAAQSDFATLQQLVPKLNSSAVPTTDATQTSTAVQSTDPRVQAFAQLGKDLQSGDLSAARQDYASIVKIFEAGAQKMHADHHSNGETSTVKQLFQQLGQALQSGDLSAARHAFSSIQKAFQQASQPPAATTIEQPQAASTGISVTA